MSKEEEASTTGRTARAKREAARRSRDGAEREALRVEEGSPGRAPATGGGARGPARDAGEGLPAMYSSSPSPGREAGGAPGDKDERVSNGAGDESAKETAGEFDEDHAQPAYYSTSPLEVIIGEDDRVQITNTRAFPWRAICSLRIRAGNGTSWIGTGWLVAPRTVITAGHCVFMRDQGGWARSIEVIPGKDGAEMPFGSVVATRFASVVGWKRDGDREYDYGTILLPAGQALGARVGHFGFADYDDAALGGAQLNLSGYPGDKGMGATQWWHARKTKSVSARVIEYEIDTVGGQSGAPVWRVVGSARHAVGIHTNGLASGNSATRIQANVYDNITAWAREGA